MKNNRSNIKWLYSAILKLHRKAPESANAFDYYFDTDLNGKSIVISGLGFHVRGNMMYILDELNSNEAFKDFTIYVRIEKGKTEDAVKDFIRQRNWTRTKTVSKKNLKVLESCKYLITEDFFPYNWIKRDGQIMINTWHGTPLKKLGLAKSGDRRHINSVQQKNFLSADYLTFPNAFTRDIMLDSYGVSDLLSADTIMMGYPRTAGMMKASAHDESIRAKLAPNGEKVYAYMPTFRGNLSDEESIAREQLFLDYMDDNLRDDQILYVNLHHHIQEGMSCDSYKHIRLFPQDMDSYQLLAGTDALISDYSSVFFDYLALRKHIILFVEDLEDYQRSRGLNMNIEDLPFDLAFDKSQVITMLNAGKHYDDTEFYDMMCGYDSVDNPQKLCRLLLGQADNDSVYTIPKSDKPAVLMYSEACPPGRDTQVLEELVDLTGSGDFNLYIGCDHLKVNQDPGGAYPMLNKASLVASRANKRLSSIGAPLLDLYKANKISFRTAIRFLQDEFALYPKRMYGDASFDFVGIYDTADPEMIIGLSLADAPHKALFISSLVAEEIRNGNKFMKDAVYFAAARCSIIVVPDQETYDLIRPLLKGPDRGKILTVSSSGEINDIIKKTLQ